MADWKTWAGIGAAGAGAAAIYGYASYRGWTGRRVVIYTAVGEGSAEFAARARDIAERIGAALYPVTNGAEVIAAIRRHPFISRLLFVGHGTTSSFFMPGSGGIRVGADALPQWVSIDTLAREVGGRLVPGAIIGLAGCSAGSSPGYSEWGAGSYMDGGAQSFAGQFRDAIARFNPWLWWASIRAHTAAGHTTANPTSRIFPIRIDQIGRHGRSLMDDAWGSGSSASEDLRDEWVATFRGPNAELWISGEPVPTEFRSPLKRLLPAAA